MSVSDTSSVVRRLADGDRRVGDLAGDGRFRLVHGAAVGEPRRASARWDDRHPLPTRPGVTHLGLAVAGLVVWIVYLLVDRPLLAWIAFADLVLVALLGGLLVRRWAADGRAAMAGRPSVPAGVELAEQHIPRPPVVLHGVFAVSTVVLVLLTALGVGEG